MRIIPYIKNREYPIATILCSWEGQGKVRRMVMAKCFEETRFLCDECERYFAIELMYVREEKRYCPSCYRYEYGWDFTELDGFAVSTEFGSLAPGRE